MSGESRVRTGAVPTHVRSNPEYDAHEQVVIREGADFKAVIAVHNTRLGPAAGGCRIFPYSSMDLALTDVLRLSRGMSYKSAMAELPLGGGKSVLVADPATDKTRALLHAMGDFIDSLDGRYLAAEDSGTSVADIRIMAQRTAHVSGVMDTEAHGGDPSPITALGVFQGIQLAVHHKIGKELDAATVAVQGVGNVGWHLVKLLRAAGARVIVADTNSDRVARVAKDFPVACCPVAQIHRVTADVFAPCAMGAVINDSTVDELNAGIVAGAANNQLAHAEHGDRLHRRGILYAPDYVINSGGIIDIYYQQQGERDPDVVAAHVARMGDKLSEVITISEREGVASHRVADRLARSKLGGVANAA